VLGLIDSGELLLEEGGLRVLEPRVETPHTGVSVLLVEDDDAQAALVTDTLERALRGAVVARAKTVAGAFELAPRTPWTLAVVDDELPDGGGTEVVERLHGTNPEMPVVLLAAHGAPATYGHGADCVVKDGPYLEALALRARALVAA
jgi:two-component system, OmpR family, response regulator